MSHVLQSNSTTDPITGWLQYGPAGLIAFCAITALIFVVRYYIKQEEQRLKEKTEENIALKAEIKELHNEMQKLLLQVPRAQNDLIDIVEIARKLK